MRRIKAVQQYRPKTRSERTGVIVVRYSNDPYLRCKEEVDVIYDKARSLLSTVETWLACSIEDEITEETIKALFVSFAKTMAVVTKDVEELIANYGITDKRDLFELRDVVTQLQEIADEIFKPYIKQ